MSFGEELESNIYEPWRFQYVSYEAIKRDMLRRQESHGWTDGDEGDFERTIRLEFDKVDQFITRKQREIDSRVAYCERTLIQQRQHLTDATVHQMYEAMDDALTDILIDLNDLSKYTRYNYLALNLLIKKHDKFTNIDRQQLLVDISRSKAPLDRQRFDTTLVKISTLHDICRMHGETRTGNAAAGADQNAFERATAKYWVHPDNITELKAILLFHLPVLVFNPNKPIEVSDSAISSVYFDNNDFDLYTGRLQRDEGAEAIRFRWYGPTDTRHVFIERKTHHAPWLDGVSVKDRFRLDAKKVDDFVALRYTAEQYAKELRREGKADEAIVRQNHFIASGVQRSINEKQLSPVMRVFYNRTAFQVPGDQRLRVSLDTDLTFTREDGIHRRKGSWRRPDMGIDHPFENLPQEEVYHFPYAVLETKLQTHLGQEPPEWLTRLLDSRLVYEVPRFSKYLHGAAHFWQPRLPLLPWWLSEMQLDIRNAKQATGNFTGLSRSKSLKPLIDGKYRMGYLESQLEKRATLKRQPSKASQAPPRPAGYGPGMVSGTMSSNRQEEAYVVDVQSNRASNPFDDPIWNRHENAIFDFDGESQGSRSQSYNNISASGVRNRNYLSDGRSGFVDSSSTDHLMEQQRPSPRSMSIMDTVAEGNSNRNSNNSEKNNSDAPTINVRDSAMLGDEEFGSPEKKKKKKKNKEEKEKERGERLEPKIFFANERTFINWLQFSALILSAALTLLNFGDNVSRIAGATFFGISMVLALYAFGRYRYRAYQITNTPRIRYDDLYGPIGLCFLLVGALIVNFVLRIQQPAETSTFLGIGNQTQQQS